MSLNILDIHRQTDVVDILDEINIRMIEQKFFAIFGPDADFSDLIMIIETFTEQNRPQRVKCQMGDVRFLVNLHD